MTRNLALGALAAVALTFSPFVSRASADFQSYYDQLSKLQSGRQKIIDTRSDSIDKLKGARDKRLDNNVDALERAFNAHQAWSYWNSYPNYYGRPYGYGATPYYYYQVPGTSYSPSYGRP